jgi:hypothetical protein
MSDGWILDASPEAASAITVGLALKQSLEEGRYDALLDEPARTHPDLAGELARFADQLKSSGGALVIRPAEAERLGLAQALIRDGSACDTPMLETISDACAAYGRLHLGQWDIVVELLGLGEIDAYCDLKDRLMRGRSRGLSRSPIVAQTCWETHQVVRRHLAFQRNPAGGWQNVYDPPLKCGPYPLATLRAERTVTGESSPMF